MRGKRLKARIVVRLDERECARIKQQAKDAGVSAAMLARQVLKDRLDAVAVAEVVGASMAEALAERVGTATDQGISLLTNQAVEVVREETRQAFEELRERFGEAVATMTRSVELMEKTFYPGGIPRTQKPADGGAVKSREGGNRFSDLAKDYDK